MQRTIKPTKFREAVVADAKAQILLMPRDQRSRRLDEKLEEKERGIERHFVMGIITHDSCCEWAKKNFPANLLESQSAKKLTLWIYDFFDNYGNKAPKRNLPEYFDFTGPKTFTVAEKEDLEDLLVGLSEEWEGTEDFNPTFWKHRMAHYRDKRTMEKKVQEARALLDNNEVEEAREIFQYEAQAERALVSEIKSCFFTSTEYIQRQIPRPKRFLLPWLSEGSLTLIYGPRGVGKTWLCLLVAITLTREEIENLEIGTWQPKHKTGVLYVDGEMNNWELQDSIKSLSLPLSPEDKKNPLMILSAHDYVERGERSLTLAEKQMQEAIYKILQENKQIKILILDNAAALTPGLRENIKDDWDPVNQWLISLRHLGVATILIHHAGKGGQQRGTSGREDAMDTIIKMDYPKKYDQSQDYAWFKIAFEKSRNLQPGDSKKQFTLRIVEHPDGGLTWQEEEEAGGKKDGEEKQKQILAAIVKNGTNKDISKAFGITEGRVSQLRATAREQGYIDKDGRPTKSGLELAKEHGQDWGKEAIGD
jgi:KaiC/GvpD/RAD55 family RecA-like ATPase